MSINVGINLNVFVGGASMDEKGGLDINFREGAATGGAFDALMGDEEFNPSSRSIKMFLPSVMKYGSTEVKSLTEIATEVKRIESTLKSFLRVYKTEDEVNKAIGTKHFLTKKGITSNQALETFVTQQGNLEELVKDLFNSFIKAVETFKLSEQATGFRMKLIRQSTAKHWPTFPKNSFESFVESMEVPEEQSKVKFTKYELDNKLDDPTPPAQVEAPIQEVSTTEELFEETKDNSINEVFTED